MPEPCLGRPWRTGALVWTRAHVRTALRFHNASLRVAFLHSAIAQRDATGAWGCMVLSSLCTPAANGCAHSPTPQAVFRALLAMAWTAGRSGGALLAPTTRASRSSLDPTKSPDLAPTKRLRRLGPRWRLLPSLSWTTRRRRDLQRCRPAKSVARAISPLCVWR